MKVKYHDAYVDIEKLSTKDLLYINFYEEHKHAHDFISAFLKEPKIDYLCNNAFDNSKLFIKNVKRYCDSASQGRKLSLKKAKKL